MNDNRFFICDHCGNLVGMLHNSGVPIKCCGENMKELIPASVEASTEKHIPVVTVSGDSVCVDVGSVSHPMGKEHLIQWVYLQTDRGGQRKCLEIDGEPKASFLLKDEKPVAVYAYCNLHGLWKADL